MEGLSGVRLDRSEVEGGRVIHFYVGTFEGGIKRCFLKVGNVLSVCTRIGERFWRPDGAGSERLVLPFHQDEGVSLTFSKVLVVIWGRGERPGPLGGEY